MYANANIGGTEKLGSEIMKIVFAKIQDEQELMCRSSKFRTEENENPEHVKIRVSKLFSEAVKLLPEDSIFKEGDTIDLDASSTAWMVDRLQSANLLSIDSDIIGDIFEVFAESRIAGEQGQFFTPRSVVDLAVKIADPRLGDTVCDPACGSGGFLIAAAKHIRKTAKISYYAKPLTGKEIERIKTEAAASVYGIDREADLVRLAAAYMAICGEGQINTASENSLGRLKDFSAVGKSKFSENGKFKQFDKVFANPPYGSKTRIFASDAADFELGCRWRYDRKQKTWLKDDFSVDRDPYVLFIERCFDMLKDRGILSIVLPETVFHAPSTAFLRHFISNRFAVQHVISLPYNTFKPYCNAKTCLLIAQKNASQPKKVVMSDPQQIGHDHRGKPLYRKETGEIWDDLSVVQKEIDTPDEPDNRFVFEGEWQRMQQHNNWMPQYHRSLKNVPCPPDGCEWVRLGDLADRKLIAAWDGHGSPSSAEKGAGDIPYIRVSDIANWEMYRNPTSGVTEEIWAKKTKNKDYPKTGDIVFVRRGSYRIGTVAMASPRDEKVLLTRELTTFRVVDIHNEYGIDCWYLLVLLSCAATQKQIPSKVFTDTTLPNIGDRWRELLLPVHKDRKIVVHISKKAESAMRDKWEAQTLIHELGSIFGKLVT